MYINPDSVITDDGVHPRSKMGLAKETEQSLCRMAADAVVIEYHTWPPECDPDLYLDVLVDQATAAIVSSDVTDATLDRIRDRVLRMAGDDL